MVNSRRSPEQGISEGDAGRLGPAVRMDPYFALLVLRVSLLHLRMRVHVPSSPFLQLCLLSCIFFLLPKSEQTWSCMVSCGGGSLVSSPVRLCRWC